MPVIDGRILADYADQIVFVMTWQKTPKQLAKRALKTLGLNEQKIAGVILNDVAEAAMLRSHLQVLPSHAHERKSTKAKFKVRLRAGRRRGVRKVADTARPLFRLFDFSALSLTQIASNL